MSQFGGPVFEMAQQRFHMIADHLEIPDDERNGLILPNRAITVCPIHMDDGRIAAFTGYRVQHHMTYGPARRHALHSQCRHRGSRSAQRCDRQLLRVGSRSSAILLDKGRGDGSPWTRAQPSWSQIVARAKKDGVSNRTGNGDRCRTSALRANELAACSRRDEDVGDGFARRALEARRTKTEMNRRRIS
jgi:hypothetical protein